MKGNGQGEQSSLACLREEGINTRDKNKSLQFMVPVWCWSIRGKLKPFFQTADSGRQYSVLVWFF